MKLTRRERNILSQASYSHYASQHYLRPSVIADQSGLKMLEEKALVHQIYKLSDGWWWLTDAGEQALKGIRQ